MCFCRSFIFLLVFAKLLQIQLLMTLFKFCVKCMSMVWYGMVDRAFVRCCSCVRTLSRCVLKFLFCSDSPPDVCLLNCYCVKPRTYHKASPSSEKATSPIGERHNGRRCDAMWFHSILLIGVMCVVLVFDMVSTVDDVYVFQPNKRAHYQFLLALTIWIFNIQSIIY